MQISMYIAQVVGTKTVFEDIIVFASRDELQVAQNKSIVKWIGKKGKHARIVSSPDGNLKLKVHGSNDHEYWTRLD